MPDDKLAAYNDSGTKANGSDMSRSGGGPTHAAGNSLRNCSDPAEKDRSAPRLVEAHSESCQTMTQSSFIRFVMLIWQVIRQVPSLFCIGCIYGYQKLISPLLGRHCRFHPSCSAYGILAIRKYGCVRGLVRTTARICRCHPWHPGGYDPP